ncbi:MAG: ankyrin-3-like isoform [Chlamydiales bacterium]|jgi:ankyrin repeat protein|nr:ankyrin-3-like isoform [Chlamydiales bacterium]
MKVPGSPFSQPSLISAKREIPPQNKIKSKSPSIERKETDEALLCYLFKKHVEIQQPQGALEEWIRKNKKALIAHLKEASLEEAISHFQAQYPKSLPFLGREEFSQYQGDFPLLLKRILLQTMQEEDEIGYRELFALYIEKAKEKQPLLDLPQLRQKFLEELFQEGHLGCIFFLIERRLFSSSEVAFLLFELIKKRDVPNLQIVQILRLSFQQEETQQNALDERQWLFLLDQALRYRPSAPFISYLIEQAIDRGIHLAKNSQLPSGLKGYSPLYLLIKASYFDLAKSFLNAIGPAQAHEQWMLWNMAQKAGQTELAHQIYSMEMQVNATDEKGLTALHLACSEGDLEQVTHLLKHGADVKAPSNLGTFPLDCILLRLAEEESKKAIEELALIAEKLLEKGANSWVLSDNLEAIENLAVLAIELDNTQLLSLLLKAHPFDLKQKIAHHGLFSGSTLLHIACRKGSINIAHFLVNSDRSLPYIADALQEIPLHTACEKGFFKLISLLAADQPDLFYIPNEKGDTPFYLLLKKQHFAIADRFSIQLDQPIGENGDTLLHSAAQGGNQKIMAYLVKNGASIDSLNLFKETPLHILCRESLDQISGVELLLSHGASLQATDDYQETPLHKACAARHYQIAKKIMKDSDLNACNAWNETPLTQILLNSEFSKEDIEMAALLIQYGANPFIRAQPSDQCSAAILYDRLSEQSDPELQSLYRQLEGRYPQEMQVIQVESSLKNNQIPDQELFSWLSRENTHSPAFQLAMESKAILSHILTQTQRNQRPLAIEIAYLEQLLKEGEPLPEESLSFLLSNSDLLKALMSEQRAPHLITHLLLHFEEKLAEKIAPFIPTFPLEKQLALLPLAKPSTIREVLLNKISQVEKEKWINAPFALKGDTPVSAKSWIQSIGDNYPLHAILENEHSILGELSYMPPASLGLLYLEEPFAEILTSLLPILPEIYQRTLIPLLSREDLIQKIFMDPAKPYLIKMATLQQKEQALNQKPFEQLLSSAQQSLKASLKTLKKAIKTPSREALERLIQQQSRFNQIKERSQRSLSALIGPLLQGEKSPRMAERFAEEHQNALLQMELLAQALQSVNSFLLLHEHLLSEANLDEITKEPLDHPVSYSIGDRSVTVNFSTIERQPQKGLKFLCPFTREWIAMKALKKVPLSEEKTLEMRNV